MTKKYPHWEEEPKNGRDIYYWYPNGDEAGFLCDKCAVSEGFCPGCGYLVAGSEWDDLSLGTHHLCAECWDDLRVELGEYDDLDYDSAADSW